MIQNFVLSVIFLVVAIWAAITFKKCIFDEIKKITSNNDLTKYGKTEQQLVMQDFNWADDKHIDNAIKKYNNYFPNKKAG